MSDTIKSLRAALEAEREKNARLNGEKLAAEHDSSVLAAELAAANTLNTRLNAAVFVAHQRIDEVTATLATTGAHACAGWDCAVCGSARVHVLACEALDALAAVLPASDTIPPQPPPPESKP